MGLYYVQPIFEDEDPKMTNEFPSHHAIMRGDERSPSNLKGSNAKCDIFMTRTLSDIVDGLDRGYNPPTRVGRKKGMSLHPRD
jgi:hypothetical protein